MSEYTIGGLTREEVEVFVKLLNHAAGWPVEISREEMAVARERLCLEGARTRSGDWLSELLGQYTREAV